MVGRTVDDLQLNIEARGIGLQREAQTNRQRRLPVAARLAVRTQSVVDGKAEACLPTGTQRPGFDDGAAEVAYWLGELRTARGRREVVLIAGVAFINQSVQSLVPEAGLPVHDRQCSIRQKLATQPRVLQPAGGGGRRDAWTARRYRRNRTAGDDRGQDEGVLDFHQALPRKEAGIPHLARAGEPAQTALDDG